MPFCACVWCWRYYYYYYTHIAWPFPARERLLPPHWRSDQTLLLTDANDHENRCFNFLVNFISRPYGSTLHRKYKKCKTTKIKLTVSIDSAVCTRTERTKRHTSSCVVTLEPVRKSVCCVAWPVASSLTCCVRQWRHDHGELRSK